MNPNELALVCVCVSVICIGVASVLAVAASIIEDWWKSKGFWKPLEPDSYTMKYEFDVSPDAYDDGGFLPNGVKLIAANAKQARRVTAKREADIAVLVDMAAVMRTAHTQIPIQKVNWPDMDGPIRFKP